jgi:ubiquinone/menaquinone biosynthesis C-methylase UbiE
VEKSETRAAYDALAGLFAERHAATPPGVAACAERFAAALRTGARVLDLGCGHGRDAAFLTDQGLAVVGADLSPGMLAQARRRTTAPLVESDMCALPFAADSFDGVWCNAALLHLPKADAPLALAEMRRALRPQGVLYLAVQEGTTEEWEATTWVPGVARYFARYRSDEIRGLLERVGFLVAELEREPLPNGRTWLRYLATCG